VVAWRDVADNIEELGALLVGQPRVGAVLHQTGVNVDEELSLPLAQVIATQRNLDVGLQVHSFHA
jgi:hypothetical protein